MRASPTSAIFLAIGLSLCGQAHAVEARVDPKLRAFLRQQFTKDDSPGFETYAAIASANLTKEGPPTVLVYLTGNGWCGSGGCTLAFIRAKGGSFQVLSQTPIVQLPVKVLPSRTRGWSDLAVGVRGGGAQPGFAKLSFTGKRYAGHPSTSPRVPAGQGTVLIAEHDRGEALSPSRRH